MNLNYGLKRNEQENSKNKWCVTKLLLGNPFEAD
jgi:hypothetical protein